MWLGSQGGADEHSYCDRLSQMEASGKGEGQGPTFGVAGDQALVSRAGTWEGHRESCSSHFHSVSSSSALDAVPVMCIIARPVSECDCYCHFADKKTGSERLSHFPQSRNYLAIGPGFRCKPGKFQRQCSQQAGPRELLDGRGSQPSWEHRLWVGSRGSGIGKLGSSPRACLCLHPF